MSDPFADLIPSNAPAVIRGRTKTLAPTNPIEEQGKTLTNDSKTYDLQSKPVYDRANAMDKVRDGFRQDKRVLMFEAAAPIYASALTSPNTPEADILLVNAIAKIGDPSTGVQQREGDAYENAAPTFEQIKTRLGKEFGLDGAGNFTPEGRKRIKEAIRNRGAAIGDQYRLARREHVDYIKSLGLPDVDPETIIGPSAALPFQRAEEAYLGRPLRLVTDPPAQDASKPAAADIKFGAQDAPAGFRMTPEQSTLWQGYLARNKGKLTPEGMAQAYEGITGGTSLDMAQSQKVIDYLGKGGDPSKIGVDYSKTDNAAEAAARAELARQDELGVGGGSASETLIKGGMGLGLTDEAAGVGRGLSKLLTGQNPIEGYKLGRDAERLRISDARKQLGYGGTALEVAGGFLSANPTVAIRAATGARQLIADGAKSGAGVGALAGFGSGEGFGDSAEKAAIGGALGGVLGGGISGLSARYGARGVNPALAEAAERQNVRLNAALVDPLKRNRTAAYESAPETSAIVGDAFAQTENTLSDATLRLGANGQAMPQELAGDVVQAAGQRFINRSRGVAKRLYDRAASLAGDTKVDAVQARTLLDEQIATLKATPNTNSGEIDFLTGLRDDLAGPMTVDAIRNLRTSIRGRIQEKGLTMTQAQSRAMGVLDAAGEDIALSVPQAAANAYKRADGFYRERQTQIETVVQKFIGRSSDPISGEAAFRRLKSMASPGGDGKKIATMMRMFEPSEQADVGATIAASLGRKAPDEPFSPALFVTQARALSPSARTTIFGPSGKQAIDDLIALSRAQRDARGRLNNSGSGRVINYKALLSSIVLSGGIGATQGATGAIVGAGAAAAIGGASGALSKISARALMSPSFAKWLASAPTGTPSAAQAHISRLSNVAARDPAISGEITQLQRLLNNEFRPAMASDETNNQDQAN